MANETLKQLNIDVNSNVDTNDRLKTNLKEFLDTTTVEAETKTALEPLVTEVKNDAKFDERLESAINKQHVTKLLEAMKAKLDSDGYAAVYANYRTTITFAIQSALRIMGFPLPKENIDGKYGTETGDAVEAFQKRQGLTPDRLAGKDTISKMLAVTLDAKYDGTVALTIAGAEESKDWYTTHTEFTEKEFGGVKNKVYKVEKFEDIPAVIAKDTVIDFGQYYFFSNGKVYDYGTDGKSIVRRGTRDELDANGNWKTAIDKDNNKVNEATTIVTLEMMQKNPTGYHVTYNETTKEWLPDEGYEWATDDDNNYMTKLKDNSKKGEDATANNASNTIGRGKGQREENIEVDGLKSYEHLLNNYLKTFTRITKEYGYEGYSLNAETIPNTSKMTISVSKYHNGGYSTGGGSAGYLEKKVIGVLTPKDFVGQGETLNNTKVDEKIEKLFQINKLSESIVTTVRGKKYTCMELFGNTLDKQPAYIQRFFQKVSNNGEYYIEIDNSPRYTYKNQSNLHFAFDFDGNSDPKWIENIEIPFSDLILNKKFNESGFKDFVKNKVSELALAHKNEDY